MRVFRPKRSSEALKVVGIIAIIVVLIIGIYYGLGNLTNTQDEKQMEIAQDAIMRAAVQCYALESQYPASLSYLVDNYGLSLDESKYVYHYRTIGSNMVPEIKVFPK